MPLVTLKVRPVWHPFESKLVESLAQGLPHLLTNEPKRLNIEEDTLPEAVQVDVQIFDPASVNIPDVWLKVVFTEDPYALPGWGSLWREKLAPSADPYRPLKEAALEISQRIRSFLIEESSGSSLPSLAIDVFWGPGHGCFVGTNGFVTQEW